MSVAPWIKDVLRGGLPEVLDLGDSPVRGDESQDGTRPEQRPPTQLTGRDNANPPGNYMGLSSNQLVMGVVFVGAGIVLARFLKG